MSNRDELASLIKYEYIRAIDRKRPQDCWDAPADAIVSAGYRKPRTITTVEEIDALPIGSAIMLFDHGVFLRVNVPSFDWIDGDGNMSYSPTLDRFLPATVLYEPEAQK